jgi:zinc/manganese transport system substrate-binding protein/manganese/iron transport system substrate-binding protein
VVLTLLTAAVSAGATGCQDGAPASGEPLVVATTTQVGDMARNVAGDRAEVRQLLHPGSDPHEYEPRPSDARSLSQATLVVRSGGEVDEWLEGLTDQAGGDAETVTLIESVQREGEDPHWWQDPRNGIKAVEAIRDALTEADPGGAKAYRANAQRYATSLKRLDARIATCVERLPEDRRKLVTSHDSLGYYARRYGFTVVGAAIPSLSSQAEPSAGDTERLVDQIRAQHVPAIFPESALNPRLERAIAREAGAKVAGALWADALGPPGSPAATYAGALADNTRTIVGALSGGAVDCGA